LFKLSKIFTKAEESNDFEVLKDIFLIYKDMLNIADMKLLEILMSDKHYLTVFGALEHIQISHNNDKNEINNSGKAIKHRDVSISTSPNIVSN
jgi:hypothetical protein